MFNVTRQCVDGVWRDLEYEAGCVGEYSHAVHRYCSGVQSSISLWYVLECNFRLNYLSIGDALNVLSATVIEIVTAVLLTAVECTEPPVLTHSTLQDSDPT